MVNILCVYMVAWILTWKLTNQRLANNSNLFSYFIASKRNWQLYSAGFYVMSLLTSCDPYHPHHVILMLRGRYQVLGQWYHVPKSTNQKPNTGFIILITQFPSFDWLILVCDIIGLKLCMTTFMQSMVHHVILSTTSCDLYHPHHSLSHCTRHSPLI